MRQIYYKFVSAQIVRKIRQAIVIEASEYDVRFYNEPIRGILPVADDRQIRDIVGRHVLGNWLSDRMVRSTAAAAAVDVHNVPKVVPI